MADCTIFDVLKEDQKMRFRHPKIWDRHVPRDEWEESEFYRNMRNDVWRKLTSDRFPASDVPDDATHTLYVRSAKSYAWRICPTSTKYQYHRPCGYIPRNMPLDDKGHKLKKDVYILTSLIHSLPPEKLAGEEELLYAGRYPYSSVLELD